MDAGRNQFYGHLSTLDTVFLISLDTFFLLTFERSSFFLRKNGI